MIALPDTLVRAADGFDTVLRDGRIPATLPELPPLACYARVVLEFRAAGTIEEGKFQRRVVKLLWKIANGSGPKAPFCQFAQLLLSD